ncbi:MAG: acyl-CoA thioesterase [Prolixibacteraceae bacterium]|nr:acyl-CoA thioesterase [Prolixibacteraceae bacterium]
MKKLTFEEKIYTYQIDFVGHVSNIVYIQWMENGRVRLLEAIGMPASEVAGSEGIFPILSETSIRYKKPLFLNNRVTVACWISKLNNASVIMEFRFYNEEGALCASGWQKGLFLDQKTQRPARLSENHRKNFEIFLFTE